jgi:hypothetical protein
MTLTLDGEKQWTFEQGQCEPVSPDPGQMLKSPSARQNAAPESADAGHAGAVFAVGFTAGLPAAKDLLGLLQNSHLKSRRC